MKRTVLLTGFFLLAVVLAVPAQAPQEVTLEKDIVYGHSDGVDLKMDLAKPPAGEGPRPAVVCIHGGAWQLGSKDDFEVHIRMLASFGYVAAAVGYRLAPQHKWPAQIEDVKCAVRYLRAHAEELGIDPNAIAALGHSAGAHLSLLLGLMDPKDGLEGSGGNPGYSSKVQAVVNFSGPTDLATWRVLPEAEEEFKAYHGTDSDGILADLLGTADRAAPIMAKASPVTYIDAGDPPILTFHGDDDTIVSVDQAKQLHAALAKAGVKQTMSILEGAGHGLTPEHVMNATLQAKAFLDATLKGAAEPEPSSPMPNETRTAAQ